MKENLSIGLLIIIAIASLANTVMLMGDDNVSNEKTPQTSVVSNAAANTNQTAANQDFNEGIQDAAVSEPVGPTTSIQFAEMQHDFGTIEQDSKNTKIFTENAQLTKQDVTQNINADVLKLYNEHISLGERITLAKSNIATMQKVYETASEQLKKGAINGYDFRLTQLTLLNSELTLMQLQLASKAIEISLNRLSGTVLSAYMD